MNLQQLPILGMALASTTCVVCGCPESPEDDDAAAPCEMAPWYPDEDGDGWGNEHHPFFACMQPDGFVDLPGDCDDQAATTFPDAPEPCDGLDNDCDGGVDEDTLPQTCYEDQDGDGFGDPAAARTYLCEPEVACVSNSEDCDDSDVEVHPGANDLPCDGVDSDCDGLGTLVAALLGQTEHETIQGALDATAGGDTVYICPGTHTEALTIAAASQIALESFSGIPDDTVLDGEGMRQILNIGNSTSVRISHLSFQGGAATFYDLGSGNYASGGAIHSCGESLSIEDCRFVDNTCWLEGGAVALLNSPSLGCGYDTAQTVVLSVTDSVFEGNLSSDSDGGAIGVELYGSSPAEVTIAGTEILDSWTSSQGGALHVDSVGDLDISVDDSRFESNEAGYEAGAVYTDTEGTLRFVVSGASSFIENIAASQGGAIHASADGSIELSLNGTTFEGNCSGNSGGAIELDASTTAVVTITESIFSDQRADTDGGALHIDADENIDLSISATEFLNNLASSDGGAIHCDADTATLVIAVCDISDNTSGHNGGALHLEALTGELLMTHSDLTNNVASYMGGAIHSEFTHLDLEDVHLIGNSATANVGAIYQGSVESVADLFLTDCSVTSHTGGGVVLTDDSILYSENTDWGDDVTDNDPWDINTGYATYDGFTTGESFICESSGPCS